MREGHVYVYYGEGKGKTPLVVGQGVRAIGEDLGVVLIQFLDFHNSREYIPLQKLEPDFRTFRFEKVRPIACRTDEMVKREMQSEIKNAFNFARKIIETGECDMLILDGILQAVEIGYIESTALADMLEKKPSYMDVIVTGTNLDDVIAEQADYIFHITTEKSKGKLRLF